VSGRPRRRRGTADDDVEGGTGADADAGDADARRFFFARAPWLWLDHSSATSQRRPHPPHLIIINIIVKRGTTPSADTRKRIQTALLLLQTRPPQMASRQQAARLLYARLLASSAASRSAASR
jgi:hypothetical protein